MRPVLFTLPAAIAADVRSASVLCTPGQASCVVQPYHFSAWTARAIVNNTMNTTGWGTLSVETATGAADSDAAFAAGYVEGAITPDLIDMQWQNMGPKPYPSAKAVSFIEQNNQYVKEQVAAHGGTDIYWAGVGLVYDQLAGMAAGYEAERAGLNALPRLGMQLLGMVTELEDIQKAVEPSARPDFSGMTPAQLDRYVFAHSHCSAMIKVTADLSELYSCHNTWTSYSSMLRLFKTYTLPFEASAGGATTVLFSGYPGSIAGVDDFYTTDRQLAVIETTNSVFNGSLYDLVTPRSVPYWARVTVATRGASTGKQWHAAFYRENSGTYNNQWMTVDYKLFTPREPLKKGLLLVSEQLPGGLFHAAEDQTGVLQRGHWPSYNVPFYPDVYQASGVPRCGPRQGAVAVLPAGSARAHLPPRRGPRPGPGRRAALHAREPLGRERDGGQRRPFVPRAGVGHCGARGPGCSGPPLRRRHRLQDRQRGHDEGSADAGASGGRSDQHGHGRRPAALRLGAPAVGQPDEVPALGAADPVRVRLGHDARIISCISWATG
jgi:hypothetical protein